MKELRKEYQPIMEFNTGHKQLVGKRGYKTLEEAQEAIKQNIDYNGKPKLIDVKNQSVFIVKYEIKVREVTPWNVIEVVTE